MQAKSVERTKNEELGQMPYDNHSLINGGNNERIILRSYQPNKKGKLYPRCTCGKKEFMVSIG